jgi:hypothetical protein
MTIIRVHPYAIGGVECLTCGADLMSQKPLEREVWNAVETMTEFLRKMNREHYMMDFVDCEEYIVMSVQSA